MKIRIEGTQVEIGMMVAELGHKLSKKVKSVSKFYPNRQNLSNYPFTGQSDIGRVYLEVE